MKTKPTKSKSQPADLITTAQAAALRGVAHSTVRGWLRRGELKAYPITPRLTMVSRGEVEQFEPRGAGNPTFSTDQNPRKTLGK